MRIGNGYDVHRLAVGRRLIIGGVQIPWEMGLQGHSDADVLLHAMIDAVLGAAGLPDIGTYFPDSSDKYKNVSSLKLAAEVVKIIDDKGFRVGNIDSVIVAQRPRLSPFIGQMKECVASAFGMAPDMVGIKATTEEGLGFTGGGLGIAAHAVALLFDK